MLLNLVSLGKTITGGSSFTAFKRFILHICGSLSFPEDVTAKSQTQILDFGVFGTHLTLSLQVPCQRQRQTDLSFLFQMYIIIIIQGILSFLEVDMRMERCKMLSRAWLLEST